MLVINDMYDEENNVECSDFDSSFSNEEIVDSRYDMFHKVSNGLFDEKLISVLLTTFIEGNFI